MEFAGVTSAYVSPRVRGRGTVDVTIASENGIPSDALIAEVSNMFEAEKEINVDVLVKPAAVRSQNITISVRPKAGHVPADVLEEVRNAMIGYVRGLGINERVLVAKVSNTLYRLESVENFRIMLPSVDVTPNPGQIMVPGNISITLMA
jgi:uncharacterized phage protein gp47/JayE